MIAICQMDLALLIVLCVMSRADVESASTGSVSLPKYNVGSFWHVFRQVHASEVASRQLLSSSRTGSSKVAETTRIIPKEQRRSEPSFTIISRIKSPWEQMLAYISPKPSWTSLSGRRAEQAEDYQPNRVWPKDGSHYVIGEAEPVTENPQRQVALAPASQKRDSGVFTIENGLVRYRGSHEAISDNEAAEGSDSKDVPEPFPTFGLWEMMKKTHHRPQKWNVLNKLLIQSSSTEIPTSQSPILFDWDAFKERLENQDQDEDDDSLTTQINSGSMEADWSTTTELPTVTEALFDQLSDSNRSQSVVAEDSDLGDGSTILNQDVDLHHLKMAVRVDDSTMYAVTHSLANGTVVFQRIRSDQRLDDSARNVSDVEMYFPGFGHVADKRPDRIWVHSTILSSQDAQPLLPSLTQSVDPEIVLARTGNESAAAVYPNALSNQGITEEGSSSSIISSAVNLGFRMMDDNSKPVGQNSNRISDDDGGSLHMTGNVTTVPSNAAENQMTPPLLKTLENLLLTHLLPPPASSSSSILAVSSPTPLPSHMLHHMEQIKSHILDDSTTISHLIQTVPMPSTPLPSTTALPEAILQPPAFYDPAINEATLSSHSVIIPEKKSAILQMAPSVQNIPSPWKWSTEVVTGKITVTDSTDSGITLSTRPTMVDQTTVKSESTVTKPPLKKAGLASLLLAHTANLVSGKLRSNYRTKSNHFDEAVSVNANRTWPTESTTNVVHVIMATPLRDTEIENGEFHQQRAFHPMNLLKEDELANNSSWNFPSVNQLNQFPELLTKNISQKNPDSVSLDEAQLPSLSRFTCGQQTTADELVMTNPSYPNFNQDAGRCAFRLIVTSSHVCQVRVEFRESRMLKPRQGSCVDQYLSVSEPAVDPDVSIQRPFCGWNTDQHFYLQLSEQPSPRYVDFLINTKTTGLPYRYSLVIQQIECHYPNPLKAPAGCLQYFPNSQTGWIKSFNFDGGQYWNNQEYRICVRSIDSSCSLALSSDDFGIKKAVSLEIDNSSGVGNEACPDDYFYIPGSTPSDEVVNSDSDQVRYCGTKLSSQNNDTSSSTIMARMYGSVHVMEFRSGVSSVDDRHQRIGFRIKFESHCPTSEPAETILDTIAIDVEGTTESTTYVTMIDTIDGNSQRLGSTDDEPVTLE